MTPADMQNKLALIAKLRTPADVQAWRDAVTDPSSDYYVRPAFDGEAHALAERERVLMQGGWR